MNDYKGLFPDDRRSDFRIDSGFPIELKYIDPIINKHVSIKGKVINISTEGLTIRTDAPLPKILDFSLNIYLPKSYPIISAKANIIWQNDEKHCYGLKFTQIKKESLNNLQKYVNRPTETRKIIFDKRMLKPTEGYKPQTGVHSTLTFKIADTQDELQDIYLLREEAFVKEDKYPKDAIKSSFDNQAVHFIAIENEKIIGTISVLLDGPRGLPLQEFIDITPYRDKKLAEIEKLAVVPHRRKETISSALMMIGYEFAKLYANRICIFALEKKVNVVELYKQIGFKIVGEFDFYNVGKALFMILDIRQDSVYETEPEKMKYLKHYIEKLSKRLGLKG